MKKNLFLRIIAMLLVVIMMGTMIVACNKDSGPDKGNTPSDGTGGGTGDGTGNGAGGNTGDGTGVEVPPSGDKEEITVDMGGYVLEAYARETEWFANEVYAEPDTGDQILQAIYDRNWGIEEDYNCMLSQSFVPESDGLKTWRTSVNSGDSQFKYGLEHMMTTASESLNGTMLNLKLLPNVNLEADYWNQSMNKEMTVGGKLYFTANEFCTSSVYFTWLMIFNMKMCEERGIDVYGMVNDGTWTIDNLYDIVSKSYEDDGDGVVELDDDTFGLTSHWNTVLTNYVFAFDIPVMHLDSNGKAVMDFNDANTPMVTAVEKVYNLFFNSANGGIIMTDAMLSTYYSGYGHDHAMCTKLGAGTSLFANTRLLGLEELRTSDTKYGIVPFPKLNEEQTNYYSHVDGRGSLIFTPYTLPEQEYEYVGLLLDELSKRTKDEVMPVIQNALLIGRYSEDSDAYKCLEMTLNGRTYSFAYVFNNVVKSTPYWTMVAAMQAGTSNFTDIWKSKSRVAEREINTALQKYANAND